MRFLVVCVLLVCIPAGGPADASPATTPAATSPAVAPQHQQWLDAVLAGKPGDPGLKEATEQLRSAVREPANEALAGRVVEAARQHPLHRAVLLGLLDERAGTLAKPGVTGPYLKAYAMLLLDVLDGRLPAVPPHAPPRARWSEAAKGDILLLYLRQHPGDKQTRERLVVLARPCAKVSDLPRVDQAPRGGRGWTITRCALDIRTVWAILIECGVLREGMKLTDALQILGQPTGERFSRGGNENSHVRWSYEWNLRLAPPSIGAELKDGKLTNFRVTR